MKLVRVVGRGVLNVTDALVSSEGYLHVSNTLDRFSATVGAQWGTIVPSRSEKHVVIPTIGRGNIGDQALLESYLSNVDGPISVIVDSLDDLQIPLELADRVSKITLRGYFNGLPRFRIWKRIKFIGVLSSAKSLSVIGADIMDGSYRRRDAALRYSALQMATIMSVPNRVLGFSWSEEPDRTAVLAAESVQTTTRLISRDPVSAARLASHAVATTAGADMVFLHKPTAQATGAPPFDPCDVVGSGYVILNASGLQSGCASLLAGHAEIVRWILAQGLDVVLLPHVMRVGDDDLIPCSQIKAVFEVDKRVHLIRVQLSPSEVLAVVHGASAVHTARMHLSIFSLMHGVAPVVLASHGKVEGLLELFALEHLRVSADDSFVESSISALSWVLDADESRALVEANLPAVRRLAIENFRGLGSGEVG